MNYNFIINHQNSIEFLNKGLYDGQPYDSKVTDLNYLAKVSPLEIHMHGVGEYDFSEFKKEDLENINSLLEANQIFAIITGFLKRPLVEHFQDYMQYFIAEKEKGNLGNIIGVALEGPLLSTTGGTPQPTTWLPTKKEWKKMISNTKGYLKYIVFSPDAVLPGGQFYKGLDEDYPSLQWIVEQFYANKVMPSLGHFRKDNIDVTVSSILQVCDIAKKSENYKPGSVLVDHLFNDMPRNFKHTWRTKEEKEQKGKELAAMQIENWSLDNLDQYLGEVPAILIKLALRGYITVCVNFDGEHVAIEIAKRVAEIMSYDGIIAMTDCASDTSIICGRQLKHSDSNTLLYQEEGIVAAGTTGIDGQIANMRAEGVSEGDIWKMIGFVPMQLMLNKEELEKIPSTYVDEYGKRNNPAISQLG
jgi:N-acetylglucosamine-6-phosphate deacetylase